MKLTNLHDGSMDGLTLESFSFEFINLNSFSKNNISKKANLRSKEFTFLNFSI